MWFDGWFGKQAPDNGTGMPGRSNDAPVSLLRDENGTLRPKAGKSAAAPETLDKTGRPPKSAPPPAPDTSALNKQIVQAVQFSNAETAKYAPELVTTPPELMVSTTTGMAVQDAKNYMNAIMQIAVAAQAVAIKKAAEGPEPVSALKEIPLLAEIQNMVTQAVGVYGNVSTTAGTSASTVINDLKSG